MVARVQVGDRRVQVIERAHAGAVAGADGAVDQVADDVGAALRIAHVDAAGVEQGIVHDAGLGPAVDVDAGVRAAGDEVVADQAMVLLGDAAAVAALRPGGTAAAEGQADALARLALQLLFAQHRIVLERGAGAGAFRECAVTGAVAPGLDEVRDQVAADGPAAGRDQVDRRHRPGGVARRAVGERVVVDQAAVGKAAAAAVDLQVGVEVADGVVHRREMVAVAAHVEGVLAGRIDAARAADRQVLETPPRLLHREALARIELDQHRAGALRLQCDRRVLGALAARGQHLAEAVGARQQGDHVARLRVRQRRAHVGFAAGEALHAPAGGIVHAGRGKRQQRRGLRARGQGRQQVTLPFAAIQRQQRLAHPRAGAGGQPGAVVAEIGPERARRQAQPLQVKRAPAHHRQAEQGQQRCDAQGARVHAAATAVLIACRLMRSYMVGRLTPS
ncbi:conserved hypothetical protein, partial [Ricinus communis]